MTDAFTLSPVMTAAEAAFRVSLQPAKSISNALFERTYMRGNYNAELPTYDKYFADSFNNGYLPFILSDTSNFMAAFDEIFFYQLEQAPYFCDELNTVYTANSLLAAIGDDAWITQGGTDFRQRLFLPWYRQRAAALSKLHRVRIECSDSALPLASTSINDGYVTFGLRGTSRQAVYDATLSDPELETVQNDSFHTVFSVAFWCFDLGGNGRPRIISCEFDENIQKSVYFESGNWGILRPNAAAFYFNASTPTCGMYPNIFNALGTSVSLGENVWNMDADGIFFSLNPANAVFTDDEHLVENTECSMGFEILEDSSFMVLDYSGTGA